MNSPVKLSIDDKGAAIPFINLSSQNLVFISGALVNSSDFKLAGVGDSQVVVQQSLEAEILFTRVNHMQVGRKLVRGESDDVAKLELVGEGWRGRRQNKSDRDTFGTVHHDRVKLPDAGSGKTMLAEGSVLRGRRRGAKDGLYSVSCWARYKGKKGRAYEDNRDTTSDLERVIRSDSPPAVPNVASSLPPWNRPWPIWSSRTCVPCRLVSKTLQ